MDDVEAHYLQFRFAMAGLGDYECDADAAACGGCEEFDDSECTVPA